MNAVICTHRHSLKCHAAEAFLLFLFYEGFISEMFASMLPKAHKAAEFESMIRKLFNVSAAYFRNKPQTPASSKLNHSSNCCYADKPTSLLCYMHEFNVRGHIHNSTQTSNKFNKNFEYCDIALAMEDFFNDKLHCFVRKYILSR